MKSRRVQTGPSPGQVKAAELCAMFSDAGWLPPTQNFSDRPFVVWHGSFFSAAGAPPGKSHCSTACETEQGVIDFFNAMNTPVEEVEVDEVEPAPVDADLTAVAPLTVDTPAVAVKVNEATEGPKEYPEADPREEELERLRAERDAEKAAREAAEKRLAELEARDAPVGLPPNPAETKLSDYYIPAEIRDLMEEGETFPQARKRLSELLNVEKAELRLKRAAGSATEAELKREADVDRLQGLFSKLGEI